MSKTFIYTCDYCGTAIQRGSAYQHISMDDDYESIDIHNECWQKMSAQDLVEKLGLLSKDECRA